MVKFLIKQNLCIIINYVMAKCVKLHLWCHNEAENVINDLKIIINAVLKIGDCQLYGNAYEANEKWKTNNTAIARLIK